MIRYFLQTSKDSCVWEEVDLFTYTHFAKAIDAQGESRYSGNRFQLTPDEQVEFQANLSLKDLAIISRMLGVDPKAAPAAYGPQGFCQEPEFINFKFGQKSAVHKVNGETFVATRQFNGSNGR